MPQKATDKYDVQTLDPDGAFEMTGYGRFDFKTLTADEADRMVAAGFPFLTLKVAPADTSAKASKTPPAAAGS